MPKSRRSALLLCCAALLAAVVAGCGSSGGKRIELVLRARTAPTADQMRRSLSIVKRRARLLDSSADVYQQREREIVVRLAGVSRVRAATVLTARAELAFYDLQADLAAPSIHANGRVKPFGSLRPLLRAAHRDTVPPHRIVIICGRSETICPGVGNPKKTYYYLFKYDPDAPKPVPEMTANDLVPSGTRADFDPQTGQPVVLIQLTSEGADKFQRITAREARRGQALWQRAGRSGSATNYFQSFAIVLDRELESFPSIDFQQYPNGISATNGIQIVGLRGTEAAKNLAFVLQTGALPVKLVATA